MLANDAMFPEGNDRDNYNGADDNSNNDDDDAIDNDINNNNNDDANGNKNRIITMIIGTMMVKI